MANDLIAKNVLICSVNFVDENGNPIDMDVSKFLSNFETDIKDGRLRPSVFLNGIQTCVFRYKRTFDTPNFIIPLGHPKGGVVYKRNETDILNIEEVMGDLFNINLIYYSIHYNIALITTFKEAPSILKINDYFNSYIKNTKIRLKFVPLIKTTSISSIARSQEVKSVKLSLNIDEQIKNHFSPPDSSVSMINALASIASAGHELDSNDMTITLNVGDRKRNSTMSKDKICELLYLLDIENNDCIKQIEVHYRNGKNDKIEKGYLKDKSITLKGEVKCPRSITGLDNELFSQAGEIINKNISDIYDYNYENRKRLVTANEQVIFQNPEESDVIENAENNRQSVHM